MKRTMYLLALLTILIFCALLLSSCDGDYYSPPLVQLLCYVDSLGTPHQSSLPAGSSFFKGIKRLKDGNALIISDKLHLWNPLTNLMTDITPTGFASPQATKNLECSLDGKYIYFDADGKIKRMKLDNLVQETLVDSVGAYFFAPVLSKNQRYLSFLKANPGPNTDYARNKGYPLFLNLVSGEVMSLPSGDPEIDTKVNHVFVDSYRERIYYNIDHALYTMDMDGSHRALVYSSFIDAEITQDGSFMISHSSPLYYRDNRDMGWRYFEAGASVLAHNSNYLYYNKLYAVYRMDLDTGLGIQILPQTVFGKKLQGAAGMAPSWDGKDMVCMVRLYIDDADQF